LGSTSAGLPFGFNAQRLYSKQQQQVEVELIILIFILFRGAWLPINSIYNYKEVKNNFVLKIAFLNYITYVLSLLTYYFFVGCQAESAYILVSWLFDPKNEFLFQKGKRDPGREGVTHWSTSQKNYFHILIS